MPSSASPSAGLAKACWSNTMKSFRLSSGRLERTIDPSKDGLGLIVVAVADIGLGADAATRSALPGAAGVRALALAPPPASRSALLGDEGVRALALHQRDVGLGHADVLEEVSRRLHHSPRNSL